MADEGARRQIVIGVTGPIGSGGSTVAEALQAKQGFRRLRLSTPIREEVARAEGKPVEQIEGLRVKLQDHGNRRRREDGAAYWVKRVLHGVEGTPDLVVEGVRNLGEVEYLRDKYRWFFLLALDAPKAMRWSRVRDREYRGDEAAFDRDDERDMGEDDPCGQQVGKCVSAADYVLRNHENVPYQAALPAKLAEKLAPEINVMRGVATRPPRAWEVHMAAAYAQSLGSRCKKRNVGAVIVSPDNIPLSIGFNENPVTMLPCVLEYGDCFKDLDMFGKLERMAGRRCPRCGTEQKAMKAPWLCVNENCREDLKAAFFPSRNMELCTAIHAEERAIRSLPGGKAPDATMYVTTCPCFQCARYIIDAGIKKVVYVEAYPVKESILHLTAHKVAVEPFEGFKSRAFTLLFRGAE